MKLMLYIYSILTYLIMPLIPIYLKKRGKKNPQYLLNWKERFGINLRNISRKPIIWIHAVSVGETRAINGLVELFNRYYSDYQILITQMTPTGRDVAKQMYPGAIVHYIPYDLPHAVHNFYTTFKPKIGLIVETEIWPNLISMANKNNIPLYIINARLSNKSVNGYKRFALFIRYILNKTSMILCQDDFSYNNFAKIIDKNKLIMVGNTKFDLVLSDSMVKLSKQFRHMFGERKIIAFASSRDEEEELFLKYITQLSEYLVLIIPRHPERFDLVANLLHERRIKFKRRSDNCVIDESTQVILGDSLGEMLAYYSVCDIAIIGGSFTDCGGQNPLEAIFMQKPVIFGTSMYNFAQVSLDIINYGCGFQVLDFKECTEQLNKLLKNNDLYSQVANKCDNFIRQYSGASQRILDIIRNDLV